MELTAFDVCLTFRLQNVAAELSQIPAQGVGIKRTHVAKHSGMFCFLILEEFVV